MDQSIPSHQDVFLPPSHLSTDLLDIMADSRTDGSGALSGRADRLTTARTSSDLRAFSFVLFFASDFLPLQIMPAKRYS